MVRTQLMPRILWSSRKSCCPKALLPLGPSLGVHGSGPQQAFVGLYLV